MISNYKINSLLKNHNFCFHSFTVLVARYGSARPKIRNYPKLVSNKPLQLPGCRETKLTQLADFMSDKVLYNSYLVKINKNLRWTLRRMKMNEFETIKHASPVPLSLKYLIDDEVVNTENAVEAEEPENKNESFYLPYKSVTSVEYTDDKQPNNDDTESENTQVEDNQTYGPYNFHNWMSDYECFEEISRDYEEKIPPLFEHYGTADPTIPASNIPCGGCGAHLHCQNPSFPGYLPRELFGPCSEDDLRSVVCQRCHFLKTYKTALTVNVDPNEYPKLMESIRLNRGLVILMVDMTDFPCSVWPGIVDLLGECPLVVVGNKIDAIPMDGPGWIHQGTKALKAVFPPTAKIKHVSLISAQTGYGVEELITKLQQLWGFKGDMYLVGCTNVGKSTLFNTLLRSDLCKVKADDLLQRATTSPWPGTTLNLLKFPILRPTGWRLYLRANRLKSEKWKMIMEHKLMKMQNVVRKYKSRKVEIPQLIGRLGRTVTQTPNQIRDVFMATNRTVGSEYTSGKGLNEGDKNFKNSRWCFDTPGVVHPDQIINELTMDELMKALPTNAILEPRMYKFDPGQTIFIAGLGRLDYLFGDRFVRIITYTMPSFPITICKSQYAEEIYEKLLGTKAMGIPFGSEERLAAFPKLKSGPNFEFTGLNTLEVCGEVVLSNAGWISIVASTNCKCVFRGWTPDGRGIYERKEPLLKFMPQFRRKRRKSVPEYLLSYKRQELDTSLAKISI